jgi:hypothetical protein
VITTQVHVLLQQFLERLDAVDVEVVGGLVEHQQVRARARGHGRAARLRSPPETSRGAPSSFTEKRCRNSTSRVSAACRSRSSAILCRPPRSSSASRTVGASGQHGFLFDQRHAQAGLALHLAVIERQRAGEHGQQR